MPIEPLVDIDAYDISAKPKWGREDLRRVLPHRFEFEQLSGLLEIDAEGRTAVGVRHYRDDEFWVRGHIPGKPLVPGILMIEACAQLGACWGHLAHPEWPGFWALAGVDRVRYRGSVSPGDTLIYADRIDSIRSRLIKFSFQGILDGEVIVDGVLTGIRIENVGAIGEE